MAEPFRLVFQALTQDLLTNVLTTRLFWQQSLSQGHEYRKTFIQSV
jgi:hypothetical protein